VLTIPPEDTYPTVANGGSVTGSKHAWTAGMVRMQTNKAHGITSSAPVPFNSLLELTTAIEKVLLRQGIRLHPSGKMKKYLVQQ
jgi:hypothetical protein